MTAGDLVTVDGDGPTMEVVSLFAGDKLATLRPLGTTTSKYRPATRTVMTARLRLVQTIDAEGVINLYRGKDGDWPDRPDTDAPVRYWP